MSQVNLSSFRGEEFAEVGQIKKGGVNYPTDAAGFRLHFAARRLPGDAPLVEKDVDLQSGGAWQLQIAAADTAGLTRAELLAYSIVLIEPGGSPVDVVQHGVWKIRNMTAET